MKRYWKYVKPYLVYFIVGPVLMITEVLGEVFMPWLMSQIINYGVAERNLPYIVGIGTIMVITAIVMALSGIGGAYFASKAAINFGADLRKDIFTKVQKFSFGNIDTYSTGSLITRLTNDITQIQNLIMMALRMMLRSPGMLIGGVIMAITINWRLAIIIACVIPVLACLIALIIIKAYPRFTNMQKKLDQLNSRIQESLTNVRVVKSFVRDDFEVEKFEKANGDLREATLRGLRLVIFNMPIMTALMNITTLLVVWFGGRQILVGSMPVGDLTAFTTYIVQILMSLMMLAMVFLNSSRAMASFKRVSEVLDTEIDITDEDAACPEKTVERGKIEFRNVDFSYKSGNEHRVLGDISFTIQPGETVGILGGTGSGKTSLVQLIPRLYDTTKGEVLVDDVNVRDYSLKNLRTGVGMVLQNNVLFSGTIEENLRWGNEDASMEEVKEAARHAQADSFISSFSQGYEQYLEQGGVNVSGGQKQRLCIARALLKEPKILILDDSTSAVDTATEAAIRECFQNELKDTTKLIIAQRISSVKDADKIIVLNDGHVSAIGNHEQLMQTSEEYQEIYYSQNEREVSAS
ncbi:MAG: ABC transporter ATP-binding protein [Lachnospiraceae bacterium]